MSEEARKRLERMARAIYERVHASDPWRKWEAESDEVKGDYCRDVQAALRELVEMTRDDHTPESFACLVLEITELDL